jgi:hypothetical protein
MILFLYAVSKRMTSRVSDTAHANAKRGEKASIQQDEEMLDQERPSGVQGASVFFSSSQRASADVSCSEVEVF